MHGILSMTSEEALFNYNFIKSTIKLNASRYVYLEPTAKLLLPQRIICIIAQDPIFLDLCLTMHDSWITWVHSQIN